MLAHAEIKRKVEQLEAKWADRDWRMSRVRDVRAGRLASVYPEYFNDEIHTPMVANFIETVARDLAEAIGVIPSLNTTSGNITSDSGKKFAQKRQKIGAHYWMASNLSNLLYMSADNYVTYGYAAWQIEPDWDDKSPRIRWVDPFGTYPEIDLEGCCVSMTRKWCTKASVLAAQYPDKAPYLFKKNQTMTGPQFMDRDLTVYKYVDDDCVQVWVGELDLVLEQFDNPMGKCPVVLAVRPGPDENIRGQFDDALGVQAARALMMRLAVEAAEKAVQAPIVAPSDMQDIIIGPDVILRTDNPAGVGRVDMRVDGSTFQEMATLERELQVGTRSPMGRNGGISANVITGAGVDALNGGFDSQIKTAQTIFAVALRKATSVCFEMDERFWPNDTKTIRGISEGAPYEETYKASRDIRGDFTCEVTYGFLAGMDPNRALVFMLQLRGDRLVDRNTVQKHLPFDVDLQQLQQNVDAEELRDALKQGLLAYVQAMGPMAAQGQDPKDILTVLAEVIAGRQKGGALEDLTLSAFQKLEAAAAEAQQAAQEAQDAAGGGGDGSGLPPMGMNADGLLKGVAPGQAGMQAGGRPSIQTLMASMGANGSPNVTAGVRRGIPTG